MSVYSSKAERMKKHDVCRWYGVRTELILSGWCEGRYKEEKKRRYSQNKRVAHVCELLKCLDGLRIIECNRVFIVTMFCKVWPLSDRPTQKLSLGPIVKT